MNRDERYYKAYMESRVISRRGLFRGLLKGTVGDSSPTPPTATLYPAIINPCQNTYIYCDSCADYCEKQALLWQPHLPPTLVYELCNGCGECAFRCPAMALEMALTRGKVRD
ncbi:4Fe-4S binding protein [Yersinia aleksiciae]|uniref:4Fe-4S binding protein n=1 Tax=Yersinia aleksiciae TaxID=263819 RepID=UPI0025AAE90C|nr:4Fe-4S binding protein [Yersinia aleksiciae]MDN0124052.1 4Fe-4S binding protein [Yersinia aleksiciae]